MILTLLILASILANALKAPAWVFLVILAAQVVEFGVAVHRLRQRVGKPLR